MAIYKSKFTGAQVDSILSQVAWKQDKLTAGTGISISNNTIAVTLDTTLYEVVSALPTTGQKANRIYLVLAPSNPDVISETTNRYIEYLWVDSKWEKIGELRATVDLSSYVQKNELDTAVLSLDGKITTNKNDIATLKTTTQGHAAHLANIDTRISELTSTVASIDEKVTPITDDPSYEVVLFKKG